MYIVLGLGETNAKYSIGESCTKFILPAPGAHEAETAHEAVIGYDEPVINVVPPPPPGAHEAETAHEDVPNTEPVKLRTVIEPTAGLAVMDVVT